MMLLVWTSPPSPKDVQERKHHQNHGPEHGIRLGICFLEFSAIPTNKVIVIATC